MFFSESLNTEKRRFCKFLKFILKYLSSKSITHFRKYLNQVILCYAEHLHSWTGDPSFDLECHVFVISPELGSERD